MLDVMLDLETLGRRPGDIILSIGAVAFDRHAGAATLGDEFYIAIDTSASTALGMTREQDTINWWFEQSAPAKAVFSECVMHGATPFEACAAFNDFLSGLGNPDDIKVWGNGAAFDNTLLRALFRAADVEPCWMFYNDQCYRTFKQLVPTTSVERVGTFHNALDDAKTQALQIMRMFHALDEQA